MLRTVVMALALLLVGLGPVQAGVSFQADLAYGSHPRQRVDLWRPDASESVRRPLVLYIHGGGWTRGDKLQGRGAKPETFLSAGFAYAALNTRMVPDVTAADMARDVASAIAFLRTQPGIDASRIVLIGHSAGAHLAALVASDPRYLEAARVPASALKAVLLLDGAAYRLSPSDQRGFLTQRIYENAFGDDERTWAAVAPIAQMQAKPPAAFWIAVADRSYAARQGEALRRAVVDKGGVAEVASFPGETHAGINRRFGEAGNAVAPAALAFLKRLNLL
jgi:acetyl esterase/lipase